ncbi:MAG: diacylglycerol kinase family protein [Candidatus Woesearchaeota archaeon]
MKSKSYFSRVKDRVNILKRKFFERLRKIAPVIIQQQRNVDFLIVYNPYSGSQVSREKGREIFNFLREKGFTCLVTQTHPKKDYLPKKVNAKFILALGGDGTVHRIVNEMIKRELDSFLVAFPYGVGNDFATSQGFSAYTFKKFVSKYEKFIKEGKLDKIPFKRIDVGKLEYSIKGKPQVVYFVNVAGINSFDTEVLKNIYNLYKRKAYTSEEYLFPLLQSVFSFKPLEYKVEYKKRYKEKSFKSKTGGFLVYNNSFCAGGNLNLPEAKIDDGYLNIILFKPIPKWNIPRIAYGIIKHYIFERLNYEVFKEVDPFKEYFKNPKVKHGDVIRDFFKELVVSPVYIFQCDGELYNVQCDKMRITVLEKVIKIPNREEEISVK